MPPIPFRAACAQFTGTKDPVRNLAACARLVKQAVEASASILFLPEASDYIAPATSIPPAGETHTFLNGLQALARENSLAICAGVHTPISSNVISTTPVLPRSLNTCVYISPLGVVTHTYHKLHLFSINHTGHDHPVTLSEASTTDAGTGLTCPFPTPIGTLGLQICFDVRFPAAARTLVHVGGADALCYPSAFTVATGRAGHWEVSLRARAVEGQCWVFAPAQVGTHWRGEGERTSWGEAMVVNPWGKVVGRCGSVDEGGWEGLCVVDVDEAVTKKVRAEMSMRGRDDIYGAAGRVWDE